MPFSYFPAAAVLKGLDPTYLMLVATVSFPSRLLTPFFFLKSSKSIVLLPLLLSLHSRSNKTYVVPATQLAFLMTSFLLFLYYF